jgi:hypothetical protein
MFLGCTYLVIIPLFRAQFFLKFTCLEGSLELDNCMNKIIGCLEKETEYNYVDLTFPTCVSYLRVSVTFMLLRCKIPPPQKKTLHTGPVKLLKVD